MYQIKKVRMDRVLDFAAEELRKYLKMMMPSEGEIAISLEPEAKDGFRLGLLEDFGLPNEAPDPRLDDIVHVETTAEGGILAGSNPRSVLFAVYRFLKENGCRFLFPGTDGEFIPRRAPEATSYHKMASYRYRGHTTEGGPSLEQVLLYIDYQTKQEMNVYALYEAFSYFRRYYNHARNAANRMAEPIDRDLEKQWHGLCEAELSKRGIQIWEGGHGMGARMLGIDLNDRYLYKEGKKDVSEEIRPNLAMINGKRGLNRRDPIFTNFCMSRPDLRTALAKHIVETAEKNPLIDQISVSLADTSHYHCECEECQKKRPSDWYMMILNEVDEMMTKKGLSTIVQLSAYVDNMFAPETERLNHPERFILKATPIARRYNRSVSTELPEPKPYVRNAWERPTSSEAYFAQFREWQKVFPGTCVAYEYHYWKAQYRDLGGVAMCRRLYEDVLSWKDLGLDGGIQDGSNKSFFPTPFLSHIYSATLWNRDLDYEKEQEDYFLHCYGEDWKKVKRYLERISAAFDHDFLCGAKCADISKGQFYNPAQVEKLAEVKEICAEARELIQSHLAMPTRPQTICWRLLWRHTEYCQGFAEVLSEVCVGHSKYAMEKMNAFWKDFGKYDYEMERYFDFELAAESLHYVVKNIPYTEF